LPSYEELKVIIEDSILIAQQKKHRLVIAGGSRQVLLKLQAKKLPQLNFDLSLYGFVNSCTAELLKRNSKWIELEAKYLG
jgi:hypothetical protein